MRAPHLSVNTLITHLSLCNEARQLETDVMGSVERLIMWLLTPFLCQHNPLSIVTKKVNLLIPLRIRGHLFCISRLISSLQVN